MVCQTFNFYRMKTPNIDVKEMRNIFIDGFQSHHSGEYIKNALKWFDKYFERPDSQFASQSQSKPEPGKSIDELLKGCEHDGSFIPVSEVKRLMEEYRNQSQKMPTDEMSPRIAKLIIKIRDLFIEAKSDPLDTMEEIWHFLYKIASPNYDKLSEDVWKEIETIALHMD